MKLYIKSKQPIWKSSEGASFAGRDEKVWREMKSIALPPNPRLDFVLILGLELSLSFSAVGVLHA